MKTKFTSSDIGFFMIDKTPTLNLNFKYFSLLKKFLFLLVLFNYSVKAQVSWIQQTVVFPPGYTKITNLNLINSNNLWALSKNSTLDKVGFSKSVNGSTWNSAGELIYGPTIDLVNFQAISANYAYTLFVNESDFASGILKKTGDGGGTWVNSGTFNGFPNIVHFFDANTGVVICDPPLENSNFSIYRTTDGGTTWNSISTANLPALIVGEYGLNTAFDYNQNSIWFATSTGRFFKTNNQGITWSAAQSPYTSLAINTNSSLRPEFSLENSNTAYILNGDYSKLSKTIDGGTTWNNLTPGNVGSQVFIKKIPDQNVLLVMGTTSSKYSTDGGLSWVLIDSTPKIFPVSSGINSTWSVGAGDILYKLNPAFLEVSNTNRINEIQIYPNPVKDFISIIQDDNSSLLYTISDITGKQILAGQNKYNERIDVSKLSKGVYFIQIKGKTIKTTLKFIKE